MPLTASQLLQMFPDATIMRMHNWNDIDDAGMTQVLKAQARIRKSSRRLERACKQRDAFYAGMVKNVRGY